MQNYSQISGKVSPPPFENRGLDIVSDISEDSSPTLSKPVSSPNRSHEFFADSPSQPWSWTEALRSPVKAFQNLENSKDDASLLSLSFQSMVPQEESFNLPLLGEVKLEELKQATKDWLKNPKNLAVCLWGAAVGVSGAILFLVMVGLLDKQLTTKKQRDAWFEVNNQILNALFTMMCLYLHPQRCLDLIMLLRWQPQDISKLRQVYCKNGTYKPHEWRHMLVVVILLQINCFAQYALCGLNWGYKRSQRPAVGVGLYLAVAIGAPAAAGIYTSLSPLGKSFRVDEENDIHMQEATRIHSSKFRRSYSWRISKAHRMFCGDFSFASRKDGGLVEQPKWKGGLFDCCQDPAVAFWSVVCPFCVFGWNMERLGFGNRYVHIVTFILVCTAPYWILTLAAINIDNVRVRKGLGITGILLSIFGLLYGGFWRIQMRKTFRLPTTNWCFKRPILTECTQWLFCGPCSLCQEVRTSEYYIVRENKFYARRVSGEMSSIASPMANSPRLQNFISEASSPISFQPSPLSKVTFSDRGGSLRQALDFDEDENNFFSGVSYRDPMNPPTVQMLNDRHPTSKSSVASEIAENNSVVETFKGMEQKQSLLEVLNRDKVLHDRSNKL